MVLTTTKHSVATFIDGASRATLIPFAPLLILLSSQKHNIQIHDATNNSSTTSTTTNNDIGQHFALIPSSAQPRLAFFPSVIIVTYLIGRIIGSTLGKHTKVKKIFYDSHKKTNSKNKRRKKKSYNCSHSTTTNKAYSTIVGCMIALQFFTFGLAYDDNFFQVWSMRLLMGIVNGIIQRISGTNHTNNINSTRFLSNVIQSTSQSSSSSSSTLSSSTSFQQSISNCTAKIWLLGFGLSTLTSGILYTALRHSDLYLSLSWMVSLAIFGAIVYATRMAFDCFVFINSNELKNDDDHNNYNSTAAVGNGKHGERQYLEEDELLVSNNSHDNLSSQLKQRRKGGNGDLTANDEYTTTISHGVNNDNDQTFLTPLAKPDHSNSQFNRARLGSFHSNVSEVYFDCESNFGDSFDIDWSLHKAYDDDDDNDEERNLVPQSSDKVIKWKVDNSNSISKYINNKCVFDDGSPSHVPAGLIPSKVPLAFQKFFKHQAETKWEETKQWRKEQKIYKIHARPHRLFPVIKEAYPHFIHGYSKLGYPVIYETPAKMKLKNMFREGHTIDDMVYHYIFFLEYLSNVLSHQHPELQELLKNRPEDEKSGGWGFVVVMDMSGLGISVFSGAVLQYLQKAGNVNNNHYPNTTTLGLLVNAPFWLSGVWGNIKPFLPKSAKADLIGASEVTEGLRKYIDDDQIPKEFGGSSPYAIDQHPYERDLHALVEQTLLRDDDDEDANEESDIEEKMDINHKVQYTRTHTEPSYMEQNLQSDIESGRRSAIMPSTEQISQKSEILVNQAFASPSSPLHRAQDHEIECTFFRISVMFWLSCTIQGSLEIALPFWFLVPKELGGLGYGIFRCCLLIFLSSALVVLLLGTSQAKNISKLPFHFPLRGYRIGIGSNSALFALLPLMPWVYSEDKALMLVFNIICIASIFVSMIIARSSSAALHAIASSAYHDKLSLSCDDRTRVGKIINILADFVRNGGLTWTLGTSGELLGVLMASPFIVWSLDSAHSYPLNAVFCFHMNCALCIILYTLSPSMKFNFEQVNSTKCGLITNTLATTASDVTALIEGTTTDTNRDRQSVKEKRKL